MIINYTNLLKIKMN